MAFQKSVKTSIKKETVRRLFRQLPSDAKAKAVNEIYKVWSLGHGSCVWARIAQTSLHYLKVGLLSVGELPLHISDLDSSWSCGFLRGHFFRIWWPKKRWKDFDLSGTARDARSIAGWGFQIVLSRSFVREVFPFIYSFRYHTAY